MLCSCTHDQLLSGGFLHIVSPLYTPASKLPTSKPIRILALAPTHAPTHKPLSHPPTHTHTLTRMLSLSLFLPLFLSLRFACYLTKHTRTQSGTSTTDTATAAATLPHPRAGDRPLVRVTLQPPMDTPLQPGATLGVFLDLRAAHGPAADPATQPSCLQVRGIAAAPGAGAWSCTHWVVARLGALKSGLPSAADSGHAFPCLFHRLRLGDHPYMAHISHCAPPSSAPPHTNASSSSLTSAACHPHIDDDTPPQ
jgi:hypothetical protein